MRREVGCQEYGHPRERSGKYDDTHHVDSERGQRADRVIIRSSSEALPARKDRVRESGHKVPGKRGKAD